MGHMLSDGGDRTALRSVGTTPAQPDTNIPRHGGCADCSSPREPRSPVREGAWRVCIFVCRWLRKYQEKANVGTMRFNWRAINNVKLFVTIPQLTEGFSPIYSLFDLEDFCRGVI